MSSQIISYAPDGTDPVFLTTSGSNIMPAAAPDARTIPFSSCVGNVREIFAMDSDGTDQRQLTFGLGPDYPDANGPHWSLDGAKIVFGRGLPGQPRSMWVIDVATGTESEIITGVQWADWQPASQ